MRVQVHKQTDGERVLDIIPSVRSQRKPVVLRQVTRAGLRQTVREALEAIALTGSAKDAG